MRLDEAGERRIVAALREAQGIEDPADDCARVDGWVATTDIVLESRHLPDAMSPAQRGAYAAAVNLSDLASCGAEPRGLLVAWGLPEDEDVETVEAIASGLATLAGRFGCPVLGGDTKPADELVLAGFALGRVAGDGMPRSAAEPGQAVCVTGDLGGAGLGYDLWKKGRDDAAVERFLSPLPRVEEGRALARSGARACIDLSDGLSNGLHRLAEASDAGFAIDAEALPVFSGASRDQILHAGGDFELLCTVPDGQVEEAAEAVRAAGGKLTRIGDVQAEGVALREGDGREPIPDAGWEHFGGQNP